MTPGAASALLAMADCIGSAGAEHWARLALERGATHAEITEAWRLWRAREDEVIQVIACDPRPESLCACPHTAVQHDSGTGKCLSRACGCTAFAKGGRRTA